MEKMNIKIDKITKAQNIEPYFDYDKFNDTLLFKIVPVEILTYAYDIGDKNVSLLCEYDTDEVVGIQIEGFEKSFLLLHNNNKLNVLWQKKFSVPEMFSEKPKFEISKEVVKTSEPIIRKKDKRLASVFDESIAHFAFT